MFGELIGLWAVEVWHQMGEPAPFPLVELGPGRGTLMADLLRAARVRPAFLQAARHPSRRSKRSARSTCNARAWAGTPCDLAPRRSTTLPDGPAIIIANEFFDALPIRQYVLTGEGLVRARRRPQRRWRTLLRARADKRTAASGGGAWRDARGRRGCASRDARRSRRASPQCRARCSPSITAICSPARRHVAGACGITDPTILCARRARPISPRMSISPRSRARRRRRRRRLRPDRPGQVSRPARHFRARRSR